MEKKKKKKKIGKLKNIKKDPEITINSLRSENMTTYFIFFDQ